MNNMTEKMRYNAIESALAKMRAEQPKNERDDASISIQQYIQEGVALLTDNEFRMILSLGGERQDARVRA